MLQTNLLTIYVETLFVLIFSILALTRIVIFFYYFMIKRVCTQQIYNEMSMTSVPYEHSHMIMIHQCYTNVYKTIIY